MHIHFKYISSLQNPLIKLCVQLEKSSERKKHQLFIIEGLKEVQLATEGGYQIEYLLFPEKKMTEAEVLQYLKQHQIVASEYYFSDDKCFKKIAYREEVKNVIAVVRQKNSELKDLRLPENPLILILENVEKPGNLGAILRTCDAAGIDAVVLTDNQTDIYNPNVVRAGLGTLFTNQTVMCEKGELMKFLSDKRINVFVTTPDSKQVYTSVDFTKASAIVMGSEAFGVSEDWLKPEFNQIQIPMYGKIDSLNVSVSAAIVIYEAIRQRNS